MVLRTTDLGSSYIRAFAMVLSILLVARVLAWRVGFSTELLIQLDLNQNMALEDSYIRWWNEFQSPLIRGVMQDVLFAALAGLALALMGKWPRRIALASITIFLAANLEHIKYNYSHIDLAMLGTAMNPTFVHGSLSLPLLKYLAAIAIVLLVTSGLLRFLFVRQSIGVIGAAMLGGLLLFGPTSDPQAPDWMQTSPLLPFQLESDLPVSSARPETIGLIEPDATTAQTGSYNLLVVYLEGLSLSSLQRGDMTTLIALANEGVSFDNYISRQIITANGLYATLTGDTPSFLNRFVKWEELTAQDAIAQQSLGAVLRDKGYHTAYLQAADLVYMSKDTHMSALGFSQIQGDESWRQAHARNGWGVDDLTLMEETLAYIDTASAKQPWFIGVLTSGTHSPYNVPGFASPSRRVALQYADQAIATLIAGLRDQGRLHNTVVILTSDEGREVEAGAGFLNDLAMNRLPLIVLHPDLPAQTIPDYLMNTDLRDLALTLTSPIDTATLQTSLPQHDDLIFGNVITGKVFWYDRIEQVLTGCRLRGFACLTWPDHPTLFGPRAMPGEPSRLTAFEAMLKAHDRREGVFAVNEPPIRSMASNSKN